MTDSEKIDLILLEMQGMKGEMQGMKADIQGLKSDMQGMKADIQGLKTDVQNIKTDVSALNRRVTQTTAELKGMDEAILDEVERVHEILERHKADKTKHTA